jgi:hypothetical protein
LTRLTSLVPSTFHRSTVRTKKEVSISLEGNQQAINQVPAETHT